MIEIRCKSRGCGKLLGTVAEQPVATVSVQPCPKHHGGRWTFDRMVKASRKGYKTEVTVALRIEPGELAPYVAEYRRTGRVQVASV